MPEQESSDPSENGDEPAAEAIFPSRGPNREEMVSNYLPESDDWEAKTQLDINDPAALAALTNFGRMFPEVDDLQPLIDDFLDHFLKSKTSVHGMSRDEYRRIMMAMFGASEDDGGMSGALKLVAADADDE